MASFSLNNEVRKLERYVMNLPMAKNLNTMSKREREAMLDLREATESLRINIVKYSTSDDTADKAKYLSAGIKQVKSLNELILIASQYDLVDVVDVAHLSAITEIIKERLE